MNAKMPIACVSYFLFLFLKFSQVHGQVCRAYPDREQGTCIRIQDCPRLHALLQETRAANSTATGKKDATTTLRKSVCSLRPPRVCCEHPAPDPATLPSDCGKTRLEDLIVGGVEAQWWAWMVLLIGRYASGGAYFPYCGGTLITDRFVLTAAHCHNPDIITTAARVGELIISTNPDTFRGETAPPVQDIPVAQGIIHPQYQKGCSSCNDIAILWLAYPARLKSGFVSPLCLPLQLDPEMGLSDSELEGEVVTAAGWGTDTADPLRPGQPNHLQEVQLTIETTEYCKRLTSKHPHGSVICAGGEGKDTCKGDSGGPLMLSNAVGTRMSLVGITSFGPSTCGGDGTQGIYTSVHYYLTWILQVIRDNQ